MLVDDRLREGITVLMIVEYHLYWEEDSENHEYTEVIREELDLACFIFAILP